MGHNPKRHWKAGLIRQSLEKAWHGVTITDGAAPTPLYRRPTPASDTAYIKAFVRYRKHPTEENRKAYMEISRDHHSVLYHWSLESKRLVKKINRKLGQPFKKKLKGRFHMKRKASGKNEVTRPGRFR